MNAVQIVGTVLISNRITFGGVTRNLLLEFGLALVCIQLIGAKLLTTKPTIRYLPDLPKSNQMTMISQPWLDIERYIRTVDWLIKFELDFGMRSVTCNFAVTLLCLRCSLALAYSYLTKKTKVSAGQDAPQWNSCQGHIFETAACIWNWKHFVVCSFRLLFHARSKLRFVTRSVQIFPWNLSIYFHPMFAAQTCLVFTCACYRCRRTELRIVFFEYTA